MAVSTVAARSRSRVTAYLVLTKPRIIELLLVTTLPTMVVAARGLPPLGLTVATLAGGALAAAGANAVNMYVDRDIDAIMGRTQARPLVTGEIEPHHALLFAVALESLAFFELWAFVNLLSAALALGATLFYVFVYSLWLKRTSTQNIVIGGAAGAVPVLVGWAAVTGRLDLAPLVLFAIVFLWTPPHFWALAIRYRGEYAAAEVPMLPAVASLRTTVGQILPYTVAVWICSLLVAPVAGMGPLYLAAAGVLGAVFFLLAARLWRDPSVEGAMRLFSYSITYLALLFSFMAIDQLVRSP